MTATREAVDIEWLRQAAQSRAFGPTTHMLLQPYVEEIERLRAEASHDKYVIEHAEYDRQRLATYIATLEENEKRLLAEVEGLRKLRQQILEQSWPGHWLNGEEGEVRERLSHVYGLVAPGPDDAALAPPEEA